MLKTFAGYSYNLAGLSIKTFFHNTCSLSMFYVLSCLFD